MKNNKDDNATESKAHRLEIVEASAEEFEKHMASVFRRYATTTESVLNLLQNGQHVAAWKKAQGIRDGMAYYMNAAEERISRNTQNEDTGK